MVEQSFSPADRYDIPGAREFLPKGKKNYRTYAGQIIDAFVPNVERQPIFCLHEDAKHPFGAPRVPVDFAVGQQMEAELKLILDYWSLDKLEGRIVICPVGKRNYELLHRLIEKAYVVEGVVSEVQQRVAEVKSLLKGLFRR